MGRLPEAYVAPAWVRELREQVRHRGKLVMLRSGLKAHVNAVLAKEACGRGPATCSASSAAPTGQASPGAPYRAWVDSLLRLIDAYTFEIDTVTGRLRAQLADQPGRRAKG